MTKNKSFDLTSVSLLSAGHFFHDIYSYFLSPALPYIIQTLGISYSQAGLLSIFHRLPAIFNPLIGKFASGKSPILIIAAAITVTAVSMSFITAAPNYMVLALLILIMGISACFFHIPSPVMIKKYSGSNIGTGMSFYMFGGEMARTIGPIVVVAAITVWGAGRLYYLIPFGVTMSLILVLKFRKSDSPVKSDDKTLFEDGFLTVLKSKKLFFFLSMMIMLSRGSIAAVLNAFIPAYLSQEGFSLWASGISLSVLQISAAAGTLTAGFAADRVGKTSLLIMITAVSPLMMIFFVYTDSVLKIIALVLTGLIVFSSAPVVMALFQEHSGKNSTIHSTIYMMIDFFTISFVLVLTGFAGDLIGLKNAFLACSVISLAGLPSALLLKKKFNTPAK